MSEKDISEIKIIYNIKGKKYIKIFGNVFVNNNRNINLTNIFYKSINIYI